MFALIIEAIDAGNAATFLLAAQQMNLSRELLLVTKQQSHDFQSVFAWQGTVSEGEKLTTRMNHLARRPLANTLLSGYIYLIPVKHSKSPKLWLYPTQLLASAHRNRT